MDIELRYKVEREEWKWRRDLFIIYLFLQSPLSTTPILMAKNTKTATKTAPRVVTQSSPVQPAPAPTYSLATDPLPTVTVNNANIAEIKSALDDIFKTYLLDQSFTPSLLHPTVHLALGYSSVVLALSSVLYSLRVSFEDSKPVLWVAVVGYSLLQTALWGWKRWVEKDEVFKGKRRRMVKRVRLEWMCSRRR